MKNYKPITRALAGLACFSLVIAAPAFAAQPKVSFIVKDMTNPFFWRMAEGAKQASRDLGVDLTVLSARVNGDIEGQIAVLETVLVKSPDAIVLVPMNGTALIPRVMDANALGIPVITADTRVDAGPGKVETFVGVDERQSFRGMAERVVKLLGGTGKVAILEGFRGSSTAELRLKGMLDVFNAHAGIKVVASIAADWDREKGLKAAEDILQAHPDIDAIVASNDQMALGAVQAVKSADKLQQVLIVGDDAIPSALSAIEAGELNASMDLHTDRVGYAAVRAAFELIVNGKRPEPWIMIPATIITAADITEKYLQDRGIEAQ